jgi:hypothetical protein
MKTIFDSRYRALIDYLVKRRRELSLTQEHVTHRLQVPRTWMADSV